MLSKCSFAMIAEMGQGETCFGHMHSLIRTFTVHEQNHWILWNISVESKGLDDTLHRMI